MSRYTAAYSGLVTRLGEVETLRRFAAEKERQNAVRLRTEVNALCRGAVVLLSSHLEAFIRELGELALDSLHSKGVQRSALDSRIFYHISRNLLDELEDTLDPGKKGEKVFSFIQSDIHFWSRNGPFPLPIPAERFNKGFSNPSFDKIRAYFNRFGYSIYTADLAAHLKAAYQPTVNMVNHLVDTRNKIAHGDTGVTKTPSEVSGMMSLIRCFCSSTDSVFALWWKAKFCSIR